MTRVDAQDSDSDEVDDNALAVLRIRIRSDLDPVGSGPFCRIRSNCLDPDPDPT